MGVDEMIFFGLKFWIFWTKFNSKNLNINVINWYFSYEFQIFNVLNGRRITILQ